MDQEITGSQLSETYWSLAEFADTADKKATVARESTDRGSVSFYSVESFNEALQLARYGWHEQLPGALELAESAIKLANQEHMMDTFNPVWDVTGAEVDVARYLQGEPECMIDFPLTKTSKSGRVITLVASIGVSGAIKPETIIRRGQLIVALALALNSLGHAVEIWADKNSRAAKTRATMHAYQRVLVKGASDELDPAQIMFALAHPAMLRVLSFAINDGYPGKWRNAFSDEKARGIPAARFTELVARFPEGTIFLPELKSNVDIPDADMFLRRYLDELGLLAED